MPDAILGRDAPVVARPPGIGVETAGAALPDARDGGCPGCEPCCQSRTGRASPTLARDLRSPRRGDVRDRRHPRVPRRRGRRGRIGHDLTEGPPIVGGQVKTFHHAVYAGILARRDVPEQMAELKAQGIGPIDLVVVNVKPFAPAVGAKLVGPRRGHRDDRRRRRGAARGGGPELGRCRGRRRTRRTTRRIVDELRSAGPGQRRDAGAARRGGVQHGRRLPRGDRRLSQPDLGQRLPAPAGPRPREGRRPALRREPAPAGGVLPRDHAPQRDARRRRRSSRATARRSTTCSTSTRPTASPATTRRRPSRSSSTPTRSGWRRTTSSSRPIATRSRPIPSRRSAASSA